ncbi:TadE/TadG family type IV pilus assembly protein [Jannaschia seohaensis]|uniref:TadE-like protein n=1 Tax=Jannaschia seohaensis TaxID=475081 RepID=A0A2Y9BZH0_9RHOB|nr:TadE/TadG family type IV pilus assembly protein [Jannaschia seohaensis]PWJ20304.1 TadE-like protein [Jannaschia seohaensis]SSA44332.1 TadE-like protein [Jannaschia seohaensis]
MTRRAPLSLLGCERGTTMVELALAIPLFLLLMLGAIDFARFYYHFSASEKALAVAARTASVRPAICPNVPTSNARADLSNLPGGFTADLPDFGQGCAGTVFDDTGTVIPGATICDFDPGNDYDPSGTPGPITCTLAELGGSTATADEIWGRLQASVPTTTTRANVQVSYAFDPALNFLGGPFVPEVSVTLTGVDFEFITPVGALASMAGATVGAFDQSPPFPALRAVVTGEDLAAGNDG